MFNHPTGNAEYEWYYLCGIGTYAEDYHAYVYSHDTDSKSQVHELAGERVDGISIKTEVYGENEMRYYIKQDGVRYRIDKSEEKIGGVFSPSSCVFATKDLLFFGTESGDVCIFNNDKRGVAPPYIKQASSSDKKEYARLFKGRIHPYYYSFAGHAPRYALKTVSDNGGVLHLTKNTVKGSLAVKLRCFGGSGRLTLEAATERSGYREVCNIPDYGFSFDELDFSSLSFENVEYVSTPLNEREKNWVEKELCLYSEKFRSPFGLASISYRFNVKGKIKKN